MEIYNFKRICVILYNFEIYSNIGPEPNKDGVYGIKPQYSTKMLPKIRKNNPKLRENKPAASATSFTKFSNRSQNSFRNIETNEEKFIGDTFQ